jgi:hypothetical protein
MVLRTLKKKSDLSSRIISQVVHAFGFEQKQTGSNLNTTWNVQTGIVLESKRFDTQPHWIFCKVS